MASPVSGPIVGRAAQPQAAAAWLRAVVVHSAVPGRLRIHLSGWQAADRETLERRLQIVPGVRTVRANPETGSVLFSFDPAMTTVERLLNAAESAMGRGAPRRARAVRRAQLEERLNPQSRPRTAASPSPTLPPRAAPRVWKLLLHAPAVLSLVLSLLACSTPLGYARLSLKALELAIQIGTGSA
jgi:hypothetical protein